MNMPEEKKKEILHRFSRLEGQIRAVQKMIKEGEQCENIAMQLSAVHSALEGATKLVVAGYIWECMEESKEKEGGPEKAMKRLTSLLLKTRM